MFPEGNTISDVSSRHVVIHYFRPTICYHPQHNRSESEPETEEKHEFWHDPHILTEEADCPPFGSRNAPSV